MFRCLLVVGLLGCTESRSSGVLEGELAPQTRGMTLDGTKLVVQSKGERPALLVFWASWCLPCRAEVPHVNQLVEQYGDSIEVIGINMGEPATKAREFARSMQMRYPSLLDTEGELSSLWRVHSLPLGVVLDVEGRIRFRGNGLPKRSTILLDGLMPTP